MLGFQFKIAEAKTYVCSCNIKSNFSERDDLHPVIECSFALLKNNTWLSFSSSLLFQTKTEWSKQAWVREIKRLLNLSEGELQLTITSLLYICFLSVEWIYLLLLCSFLRKWQMSYEEVCCKRCRKCNQDLLETDVKWRLCNAFRPLSDLSA